mgnify:CR=1 FL=1
MLPVVDGRNERDDVMERTKTNNMNDEKLGELLIKRHEIREMVEGWVNRIWNQCLCIEPPIPKTTKAIPKTTKAVVCANIQSSKIIIGGVSLIPGELVEKANFSEEPSSIENPPPAGTLELDLSTPEKQMISKAQVTMEVQIIWEEFKKFCKGKERVAVLGVRPRIEGGEITEEDVRRWPPTVVIPGQFHDSSKFRVRLRMEYGGY